MEKPLPPENELRCDCCLQKPEHCYCRVFIVVCLVAAFLCVLGMLVSVFCFLG